MNATLRRSRLLVVVVALALAAGRVRQQRQVRSEQHRRRRSASATLDGAGSSFQKTFNEAAIAGFQDENDERHDQLRPVAARVRARRALQTKTVDFAGTDSLPKPDELSRLPGRHGALLPDRRRADHGVVQPARRREAAAQRHTLAKIFSLKIKKWNDAAIASRQPGRRRCRRTDDHRRAPRRQLGHDDELHEVPRRRRPDRLDARQRRHRRLDVARHDAGRREELRCRADREVDRRCGRLRRPRRRDRGRAAVRGDQERGRQVRRADASEARRPRWRRDVQGRPLVRPDQRSRRRGVPDHVADLDHRLREADEPRRRAPR